MFLLLNLIILKSATGIIHPDQFRDQSLLFH